MKYELGDTDHLTAFERNEEWLLASIAISLKRIADHLQSGLQSQAGGVAPTLNVVVRAHDQYGGRGGGQP